MFKHRVCTYSVFLFNARLSTKSPGPAFVTSLCPSSSIAIRASTVSLYNTSSKTHQANLNQTFTKIKFKSKWSAAKAGENFQQQLPLNNF